jgi:hypothetical protein
MKKLSLESFQSDAIKSEISRKIMGGSGESTSTSTCTGTTQYPWYSQNSIPDSSSDGDTYTSC